MPDRPLDLHENSNLSLPGVQDKLLLVRVGEAWARPVGGQASTHILDFMSDALGEVGLDNELERTVVARIDRLRR